MFTPTLVPVEMQDTLIKALGLSVNLNGSAHRLTKAIEKCVATFNRDAAKRKVTTES